MRPAETEFPPYFASYIARVPETDPLPALEAQPAEVHVLADRITLDDELYRYALGKWSVRQVVDHMIDTERVMGYRAFCIARGEGQPLPGFDEKEYVTHANADERSIKELAHEFAAVRHANLWAIRRWGPEDWDRNGTANGKSVSARAIAYIMAGHVRHHMALLREKYGLEV